MPGPDSAHRPAIAAARARPSRGAPVIDAVRLSRLRWRCRRGMLENDLVLTRFLDARGEELTETEEAMLSRLLDLSDNDLWDLLSGRAEGGDPEIRPLLAALRRA